ncbi:DegT/DnrJ/EryC1/StrS family aminotransferase [Streptomyces orinoci]|uniref:DegT/DnrJ/EryC1/StrS family aminotransferase n=1 Tax=Streptomyces orinoci TaxID=67339 RepID=A0ABV3JUV8_STRON|nr:DegT/DnrJ/EryC1/StrS family aminotransferase [Streptomyces orinoci]
MPTTTDLPARLGGRPVVAADAHQPWPQITDDDRRALDRVLTRGVLAGPNAPELRALEEEYAELVGVRHCVFTGSGTSSLHAALAAVGVRAGDEVVVPAFTFVASGFAAVHQGADVVFCDVDPRTYNLDATALEACITERTAAIMAVHVHGQPADMDEILAVAARHGVPVVEDNAQAHGIRYRGRVAGGLGAASGASINVSKNLSGGEGGLFTTDDDDGALVARRMVLYGEDVRPGEIRPYWSHGVGYNYRGQELVAAFARSQLPRLQEFNARAMANAAILDAGLRDLPGIRPPFVHSDREASYWRYATQLDPEAIGYDGDVRDLRDTVMHALSDEGVEVNIWQPQPVPAQPAFRRRPHTVWHPRNEAEPLSEWHRETFPAASRICDSTMNLGAVFAPLYVQRAELMESYVEAVHKVFAHLDQLLELPVDPQPRNIA